MKKQLLYSFLIYVNVRKTKVMVSAAVTSDWGLSPVVGERYRARFCGPILFPVLTNGLRMLTPLVLRIHTDTPHSFTCAIYVLLYGSSCMVDFVTF